MTMTFPVDVLSRSLAIRPMCGVDGCLRVRHAKGLCKVCYNNAYNAAHPGAMAGWQRATRARRPEMQRANQLMNNHGITVAQWDQMFAEQEGRCAICERNDKPLDLDHNHTTGELRKLLCRGCNSYIGKLETGRVIPEVRRAQLEWQLARLSAALNYLEGR